MASMSKELNEKLDKAMASECEMSMEEWKEQLIAYGLPKGMEWMYEVAVDSCSRVDKPYLLVVIGATILVMYERKDAAARTLMNGVMARGLS